MVRKLEKTVRTAQKLEAFLRKELGLTEKQIRHAKYVENGICVNGGKTRVSAMLKAGDLVTVLLSEEEEQKMLPAEGEPEIIYEDEDLLIVNKPAGTVVHPSHGHYADSMLNLLAGYYQRQGVSVNLRVVGRLDKETSGALVLAKHPVAAARLAQQKEDGTFQKEYLAVPVRMPLPAAGSIRTPLKKDPLHLNKMQVTDPDDPEGLAADTYYETSEFCDALRVTIGTGRTHQIRVHLASIGCPLAGDRLYGEETVDEQINRTALHARKAVLRHPITGELLQVEAPLPEDLKTLLQKKTHSRE